MNEWPTSIPEYLVNRLLENKIPTPVDALLFTAQDLSEATGISLTSSKGILISIAELYAPPENEGLHAFLPSCYISTSLPKLDRALGGGLRIGTLVEFSGESGVGKTQICQTLAASALLQNRPVYWIDTEGTFRPERVSDILADSTVSLDSLSVCRCGSIREVLTALHTLSAVIERSGDFALVVIDSIASAARFTTEKLADRQKTLHQLSRFVKGMKSVTVTTNHVIGDLSVSGARAFKPALGNTWAHDVNARFLMQMEDSAPSMKRRWIQVVKAQSAIDDANATVCIKITSAGIKEV